MGAFEIEYQVLDGGDLDVDFMLFSPAGRLIVDEKRSEEGLHEVASAEEGDYQICFDNIFSRMTDKTVFWEVFVEDDYDYGDYDDDYDDYYDDDDKPKKKDLTKDEATEGMMEEKVRDMTKKLLKMKTNMHRTSQFQAILRAFEAKDRNILEANLKRVNNWSTIHLGVMLATAIFQVFLLRSFFSAKPTATGGRAMT